MIGAINGSCLFYRPENIMDVDVLWRCIRLHALQNIGGRIIYYAKVFIFTGINTTYLKLSILQVCIHFLYCTSQESFYCVSDLTQALYWIRLTAKYHSSVVALILSWSSWKGTEWYNRKFSIAILIFLYELRWSWKHIYK